VNKAMSPLAIVVLPEPLVGAAIRNAVLGVIFFGFCCKIKKNPCNMHHISNIFVSLPPINGNLVADAA
jgi:hypothetical protein